MHSTYCSVAFMGMFKLKDSIHRATDYLNHKTQNLTLVVKALITCLNLVRIFSRLANNSSFEGSLIGRAKSIPFRVSNNLIHLKEDSKNVWINLME